MSIYEHAGIVRWDELWRPGDEPAYVSWWMTKIVTRDPKFIKLISRAVYELNQLGFGLNMDIACEERYILVSLDSFYVDEYYASACISSDGYELTFYDHNDEAQTRDEFVAHHKYYMSMVAYMNKQRSLILREIAYLLPLPIAEEIAAEFVLI